MKFTNKIPQWAITQSILGPLESNSGTHKDLIPSSLLKEALNRTVQNRDINEDMNKIASISPTIKNIINEDGLSNKKASINSDEAILESMGKSNRELLTKSMNSGTVRPIQTFDDMVSTDHSNFQIRQASNSLSLFGEKANEETISDLSRQDIYANKEAINKKFARKSSEEVAEEQKARKLGAYNSLTGLPASSFVSSRTAHNVNVDTPEEDLLKTYNMFSKASVKNQNNNSLSDSIKKTLLEKLSNDVKSKSLSKSEAAIRQTENRIAKASEASKRHVEDFYNTKENAINQLPTINELKAAIASSEFSTQINSSIKDKRIESKNFNKARNEAIAKTASKKKEVGISSVSKPKQTVAENALKSLADKALKDYGVEEI